MSDENARRRVCLVHSPKIYYEQSHGTRFLPLWAYTLAAHAPADWEPLIHDCAIAPKEQIPEAEIYCLSGINQDLDEVRSAHAYLKRRHPGARFWLGGPITWSFEQDGRLDDLAFADHLFMLDGEKTFPEALAAVSRGEEASLPKVIRAERFPLRHARVPRFDLLAPQAKQYYGGVLEVSRGCPFLCEFCDIRVLPNNNVSHGKNIDLIIAELDAYYDLGIRQLQFACDNFIGDIPWARRCVDAILAWVERRQAQIALYTWCTINIAKMPELLAKMRRAGFSSLFIGVESFNTNSILETAKIQNRNDKLQLVHALRTVQSFGFIVVPGLIFGFDSDTPTIFDDTLKGLEQSGLIAGDPTFLLALPGTPLYARMKRTHRLVEHDPNADTLSLDKERVSKIESNIKFLRPTEFWTRGFIQFIRQATSGQGAYARFASHVDQMMTSENFVPGHNAGYGNVFEFLRFQFRDRKALWLVLRRIGHILRPGNFWAVFKAYRLVRKHRRRYPGLHNHFMFWLFTWTNLILKYQNLKEADFKLHAVDANYDLAQVWQDAEKSSAIALNARDENNVKVGEQQKRTREALLLLKDSFAAAGDMQEQTR